MPINKKTAPIIETVLEQFICFNTPENENVEYDPTNYEEDVFCMDNLTKVSLKKDVETNDIYSSGKIYTTVSKYNKIEITTDNVAYPLDIIIKMAGHVVGTNGLVQEGNVNKKKFFAYGKIVQLSNEKIRYEWYPKCYFNEVSEDVETLTEKFKEQGQTVSITALKYDDEHIRNYVSNELDSFKEGLTKEIFFSKPILSDSEIAELVAAGA